MRLIRKWLLWLSRRAMLFFGILIFGVIVFALWFISINISNSHESVAIAIAAISAFFAAVSSIGALVQAIETQRQRENLERPYILTYFDITNKGAIYFVIENFGASPAKDIRIKFDPSPVDFRGRLLNEISLFEKPIAFLPPRKSIRQIIESGHKLLSQDKLDFKIYVSYASLQGELFNESDIIDLNYLKDATLPTKTIEEHLELIAESLKTIQKTLEKVQHLDAIHVEVETRKQREERIRKTLNDEKES